MRKRLKSALLIFSALIISSLSFAQDFNESKESSKTFKRFYNTTDVGLLLGSSKNNLKAPFSFMSVTGYHITEKLAIGLGIGCDFLEETYIPLVVDLRYYFRNTNFSPFMFLQGGYAISTESEVDSNFYYWSGGFDALSSSIWPYPYPNESIKPKGGFILNPGLGLRKMFSENFGISFSVSYRFQRLNYDSSDDSQIDVNYNRMNIRVGIIIK